MVIVLTAFFITSMESGSFSNLKSRSKSCTSKSNVLSFEDLHRSLTSESLLRSWDSRWSLSSPRSLFDKIISTHTQRKFPRHLPNTAIMSEKRKSEKDWETEATSSKCTYVRTSERKRRKVDDFDILTAGLDIPPSDEEVAFFISRYVEEEPLNPLESEVHTGCDNQGYTSPARVIQSRNLSKIVPQPKEPDIELQYQPVLPVPTLSSEPTRMETGDARSGHGLTKRKHHSEIDEDESPAKRRKVEPEVQESKHKMLKKAQVKFRCKKCLRKWISYEIFKKHVRNCRLT